MNYRSIFILNAFVAVLLGLGFLIVPGVALTQFGVDEYAATKFVGQFFGVVMFTIGLLIWFAKDVTEEATQKNLGMALLAGAVLGLIVTVLGTANGAMRTNAWMAMLVYLLFALAYAYLLFLKPRQLSHQ
jgi:cadmium resistance protein CadD (predicted permease)